MQVLGLGLGQGWERWLLLTQAPRLRALVLCKSFICVLFSLQGQRRVCRERHSHGSWHEGLAARQGETERFLQGHRGNSRKHPNLEQSPHLQQPLCWLKGVVPLFGKAGMSPDNALLQHCPGSAWLSLSFLCLLFVCLIWFQIINCKQPWLMV